MIIQSDSIEALSILSNENLSRSTYGHLVAKINALMEEREFIPQKICRDQNRVADCLANYNRTESCTAVWLQRGPSCIEEFLSADCNPIT